MKPRKSITFAAAIGMVALIAPIILSLRLAWDQSVTDERADGIRYASDVVRRGEETASQFSRAIKLLNNDHFAPCSSQEIDLMRQIDVGSSYLQMVGRISGNTLMCTSLGTNKPLEVGPPTLITEHGVHERMNVSLGPHQLDRLDLLDRDGVAVLVDTSLLVDVDLEGSGISLAMTVPSSQGQTRLVEATRNFKSSWYAPIGRGRKLSFVDGPFVVSQVRSRNLDIAGVSLVPMGLAVAHVVHFAVIFVPIGCICGAILGWTIGYISRARSSLQGLLRTAARQRAFSVDYQPVIELATGRIVGAEALVRWKREDGTVISPANFIGLAEESGIITLITENVVHIVRRDLPKLLALDPAFHVAINLTATDLKSPRIGPMLQDLLRESGAAAHNIILEATEHGFVSGGDCQQTIAGFRAQGFRIAIDDFGTGYSCLSSLQQIELDLLKIDKSFVDTIGTTGVTSEVVLHIIDIAQSLGLRTIAEGVETSEQAEFLKERGVDQAQGWFFGKPMPLANLLAFMQQRKAALSVEPDSVVISHG